MVELESPTRERLKEAEEKFNEILHEDSWIGSPESSMEMGISGRKSPLTDPSLLAVEPYLDDARLQFSLRGVSQEDFLDMQREKISGQ